MYDRLFSINESPNIIVTSNFSTTVLEAGNGVEERNVKWLSPLLSFDLSKVLLRKNQLQEILEFFATVRGSATPFRYRDWSDFLATDELLTNKYGSTTQGILYPPADGSRIDFQILKRYEIPNCIHYRPITNPVANTISIYLNNNLVTNWTHDNGKITFATAPVGALTVDCEFDVPVAFSSDELNYRLRAKDLYSIESLKLNEVRIDPYLAPNDSISQVLVPFKLCNYFDSLTSVREQTELVTLASGYDKRTSRYTKPKGSYSLGKIPLRQEELDYLITFWRIVKGKGLNWSFEDKTYQGRYISARFDDDSLILRLNRKYRYEIDTIKAIEVVSPLLVLDLAEVPTLYSAGSEFYLAGRIYYQETKNLPVNNIPIVYSFTFGATGYESGVITPSTAGFFLQKLKVDPTLTHPDTGILTLVEQRNEVVLESIDISTNSTIPNPFSASYPTSTISGGKYQLTGVGIPGSIITVTSNNFDGIYDGLSTTVATDKTWSLPQIQIPYTMSARNYSLTISAPGFNPIVRSANNGVIPFAPDAGISPYVVGLPTNVPNTTNVPPNTPIDVTILQGSTTIFSTYVVADNQGNFNYSLTIPISYQGQTLTFKYLNKITGEIYDLPVIMPSFNPTISQSISSGYTGKPINGSVTATANYSVSGAIKTPSNAQVTSWSSSGGGSVNFIIPVGNPAGTYTSTASAANHTDNTVSFAVLEGFKAELGVGALYPGATATIFGLAKVGETVTVNVFGNNYTAIADSVRTWSVNILVPNNQPFGGVNAIISVTNVPHTETISLDIQDLHLTINCPSQIYSDDILSINGNAIPGKVINLSFTGLGALTTASATANINGTWSFGASLPWLPTGNYTISASAIGEATVGCNGSHEAKVKIILSGSSLIQGSASSQVAISAPNSRSIRLICPLLGVDATLIASSLGDATFTLPAIDIDFATISSGSIIAQINTQSASDSIIINPAIPLTIDIVNLPIPNHPTLIYRNTTYTVSGAAPTGKPLAISSIGNTISIDLTNQSNNNYTATLVTADSIGDLEISASCYNQPSVSRGYEVVNQLVLNVPSSLKEFDNQATISSAANIVVTLKIVGDFSGQLFIVTGSTNNSGIFTYTFDLSGIRAQQITITASNSPSFDVEEIRDWESSNPLSTSLIESTVFAFDFEESTGNFIDVLPGSNKALVPFGAITRSTGKIGQGVLGSSSANGYLTSNFSINLSDYAVSGFSISLWTQLTLTDSIVGYIFQIYDPVTENVLLALSKTSSSVPAATLRLFFSNNTSTANILSNTTAGTLSTTNFEHLVFTYEKTVSNHVCRFYRNGNLIDTVSDSNISTRFLRNANNVIRILGNIVDNTQYFKGKQDLLTWFDRPITDLDVIALYNDGLGLNYPYIENSGEVLRSVLIRNYGLNQNLNSFPSGNDLVSLPATSFTLSRINYGYQSGSNSFEQINAETLPSSYTITFWVFMLSATANKCVMEFGDTVNFSWRINWEVNNFLIGVRQVGGNVLDYFGSSNTLSINTWYQLRVNISGTTLSIQLNTGSGTLSTITTTFNPIPGSKLYSKGGTNSTFVGANTSASCLIDAINIFGANLTNDQFTYLYNQAAGRAYPWNNKFVEIINNGLRALFDFNTLTDTLGTATITAVGSPTLTTGLVGSAYQFAETTNRMVIANLPSMPRRWTIFAWIYITSSPVASNERILYFGNSAGSGTATRWSIDTTTEITVNFGTASLAIANNTLNTWHMIAVTYDGSTGRLYKNGALVNSVASPSNVAAAGQWGGATLGSDGTNNAFPGRMDENIGILDIALPVDRINYLYNNGTGVTLP